MASSEGFGWLARQGRDERPVPASGLRASDADREAVVEVLRDAVAHGRLTFGEFEDRTEVAYAAKTFGELEPLTADLPTGTTGPALPNLDSSPMVAVLSSDSRRGRWVVPARLRISAVLGSVDLDFCEAVLSSRDIFIEARVVLGTLTLVVPEGISVRVHGVSVAGSRGSRGSRSRRSAVTELATIDVHGVVILGSIDVRSPSKKRRAKLSGPQR